MKLKMDWSSQQTGRWVVFENYRSKPLWVFAQGLGPQDPNNVQIQTGEAYAYQTPNGGAPALKWFLNQGCNEDGTSCAMGGMNLQVGSPPIGNSVEATFSANDANNTDYLDLSLVAGFSMPFDFGFLQYNGLWHIVSGSYADCSGLSLSDCPQDPEDLRFQLSDETLACFSPCYKYTTALTDGGMGQSKPQFTTSRGSWTIDETQTLAYCAPGPPASMPYLCNNNENGDRHGSATGSQWCWTDSQSASCPTSVPSPSSTPFRPIDPPCDIEHACLCCCEARSTNLPSDIHPIINHPYVDYVHSKCPVYAWTYDDAVGTRTMPSRENYVLLVRFFDDGSLPPQQFGPGISPSLRPSPDSSFPSPGTSSPGPGTSSPGPSTSSPGQRSQILGMPTWLFVIIFFAVLFLLFVVLFVARRQASGRQSLNDELGGGQVGPEAAGGQA